MVGVTVKEVTKIVTKSRVTVWKIISANEKEGKTSSTKQNSERKSKKDYKDYEERGQNYGI